MVDCKRIPTCVFFHDKMARMPAMADRLKETFCRGDFMVCARYQVLQALGADAVPGDLFPNMQAVADALIQGGKST